VKRQAGFTLIELLIVIAIISVLAVTLIPNLVMARTRAMDTAAYTYLREAITMQMVYWTDEAEFATLAADLETAGLKAEPANVDFNVVAANNIGFCMTAQYTGSSKIYHVTLTTGITDSDKTPVCATAN
jgi:prepilin-type N-terminal cleavage/methylation domain-containing protein